jgi:hypothetical protein
MRLCGETTDSPLYLFDLPAFVRRQVIPLGCKMFWRPEPNGIHRIRHPNLLFLRVILSESLSAVWLQSCSKSRRVLSR